MWLLDAHPTANVPPTLRGPLTTSANTLLSVVLTLSTLNTVCTKVQNFASTVVGVPLQAPLRT